MIAPTVDTITRHLHIPRGEAEVARSLMKWEIEIESPEFDERFPNTRRWLDACLHAPGINAICMMALNELLNMHGVETLEGRNHHPSYWYLNAGDSYGETILFNLQTKRYRLTSYGDLVEKHPNRFV